jgi:hypothetical protein
MDRRTREAPPCGAIGVSHAYGRTCTAHNHWHREFALTMRTPRAAWLLPHLSRIHGYAELRLLSLGVPGYVSFTRS